MIEISLKTAYYRVIGLVPATVIDRQVHRLPAENAVKAMIGLPAHPQGPTIAGHNVIGWARLIDGERGAPLPGRVPLDANLATELHSRMRTVFDCWAEFLRYRANRPHHEEIQTMRESARWTRRHYRELWR